MTKRKPLKKRPDGTFELQPGQYEERSTCEHAWQPVSFVFETELLYARPHDHTPQHTELIQRGIQVPMDISPSIRQPDTEVGKVYCVCMKCASHSYVTTKYIGYYLGGSDRDGLDDT